MKALYFEQTKPAKDGTFKRYKVLKFGPGVVEGKQLAETVTLKGLAEPFIEAFTRERFEKMGYRLIQVEEENEDA
jgi:hypothetical protein